MCNYSIWIGQSRALKICLYLSICHLSIICHLLHIRSKVMLNKKSKNNNTKAADIFEAKTKQSMIPNRHLWQRCIQPAVKACWLQVLQAFFSIRSTTPNSAKALAFSCSLEGDGEQHQSRASGVAYYIFKSSHILADSNCRKRRERTEHTLAI